MCAFISLFVSKALYFVPYVTYMRVFVIYVHDSKSFCVDEESQGFHDVGDENFLGNAIGP